MADPARVLLVSTQNVPELAEQVTTRTLVALTAPGQGRVCSADGERPFAELFAAALAEIDQRGTSTS